MRLASGLFFCYDFFAENYMKRGKLIVIDGIDGSGKATQTRLLAARLKREGYKVKTIDFPRYYDNFFGKLIGEYLSGIYGDFIQADPRLASVLYAADRFESDSDIKRWLKAGFIVLVDRYVSANQIHQGGKIADPKKRKVFLTWLDTMEHEIFKIPRPDLVVYLDVPLSVSTEWLKQKIATRRKKYLKGRKDVAEDNLLHLKHSRESALSLTRASKNWHRVECCRGVICLSPEQVHEQVFTLIQKHLR